MPLSIANRLHAPNRRDRVRDSFPFKVNYRIDSETEGRVHALIEQGPEAISHRIHELDQEWDIDRALMANFAILGGGSFIAGLLKNRGWMYLFGVQMGFLLYHSIKGWCPPASVMRRMGFRTQKEIEAERYLLVDSLEGRRGVTTEARSRAA